MLFVEANGARCRRYMPLTHDEPRKILRHNFGVISLKLKFPACSMLSCSIALFTITSASPYMQVGIKNVTTT